MNPPHENFLHTPLEIRERPVQHYSEVLGSQTEGQDFVIEDDFQLTFSFLVEMEDGRQRFCGAELQPPGLELFTYSRHVVADAPSAYYPLFLCSVHFFCD